MKRLLLTPLTALDLPPIIYIMSTNPLRISLDESSAAFFHWFRAMCVPGSSASVFKEFPIPSARARLVQAD